MMIVYEAESMVKFVIIDPKRLIGRSNFCEKDIPGCPMISTISAIFGNHTANTNTARLITRARSTYKGFRNTFFRA